jgi:hypothetical protein
MAQGRCICNVKYLTKDVDIGLYRRKPSPRDLIKTEEKHQD